MRRRPSFRPEPEQEFAVAHARSRARLEPLAAGALARVAFLGAAGEVTGSCFLVETPRARVLVDCGMFQGGRAQAARNWSPFEFDPASIDAVLLTHAHIDHCGLLPRLVAEGFRGRIHASRATADVTRVMLEDSARIQQQDAQRATRKRREHGRGQQPIEPLYTVDDAERACERLRAESFEAWFEPVAGLRARLRYASHILGAGSFELAFDAEGRERRINCSGDIGRYDEPLLRGPDSPDPAELVLMEATYGDRDHRSMPDTLREFEAILNAADEARANAVVPIFALGRAQEVLYHLGALERAGRVRPRPVFLDSPMAINVTELYRRHGDCLEERLRRELATSDGALSTQQLSFTRSSEESIRINGVRGAVILSASGMCEAGRILHHLKHNLGRPGTQVVMAGFQAAGTLGRALVDGARRVRVLGAEIEVAARVHTLGGFSAHAGQSGLLSWLRPQTVARPLVALVHAEPEKRAALAAKIAALHGLSCATPERGESL
ncbi:MAG: MBL fold metallo-hydrolase, partial [Planctomycetota bacterium]